MMMYIDGDPEVSVLHLKCVNHREISNFAAGCVKALGDRNYALRSNQQLAYPFTGREGLMIEASTSDFSDFYVWYMFFMPILIMALAGILVFLWNVWRD